MPTPSRIIGEVLNGDTGGLYTDNGAVQTDGNGNLIAATYGGKLAIDQGTVSTDGKGNLNTNSLSTNSNTDVKNFGAMGDGLTDDTASLQAAINACGNIGGGEITLGAGTFLISAALTIPSTMTKGFRMQGSGWSTVLLLKAATNDYAIKFASGTGSLQSAQFVDFKIDGNNFNQTAGGGILGYGANRCLFENLWIHNAYNEGIYLQYGPGGSPNPGYQNWISNCLIEGGKISPGNGTGIRIANSNKNFIDNCTFQANAGANGTNGYDILDAGGNNLIQGCTFVNGKGAIRITANQSKVIGCTFDTIAGHGVNLTASNNNIIEGCTFFAIGSGAASANSFDGVYTTGLGNRIMGNYFDTDASNTNGTRSFIFLDTAATGNTISQNSFVVNTGSTGVVKIKVTGGVTGNTINLNTGYVTESSGTASLAAGNTAVTVTHGLDYTPASSDISVVPTATLGSAAKFWISTITSTQFNINTDVAPGGGGTSFAWMVFNHPGALTSSLSSGGSGGGVGTNGGSGGSGGSTTSGGTTTSSALTTSQFATTTHLISVPGSLQTSFPYKTGAWWQQVILGASMPRISPDPYQVMVAANGLYFTYPKQHEYMDTLTHIVTPSTADLKPLYYASLLMNEPAGSFGVTAYDELTCTVRWTASGGGTKTLTSVIAQGCPYNTVSYNNLTPVIKIDPDVVVISVNGSTTPGAVSGNTIKIATNGGQTWKFYSSASIGWTWSGNNLTANAPFTGTIRGAFIQAPADEATLDTYSTCIPIGSTVSVVYTGGTPPTGATYTFTWTTTGTGSLLMMALPHQQDSLVSPTYATGPNYYALKGMMRGVVGTAWNMAETWPAWILNGRSARAINGSYTANITTQLNSDKTYTTTEQQDTYFFGKAIQKMGRHALIADELGQTATAASIRTAMETALNPWMNGTSTNQMMYDQTWGGIVSAQSITATGLANNADFSSGKYCDHHFHYGYWVYAAAVIGMGDSAWLTANAEKLTELVHDYCNPLGSGDNRFCQNRHKDWYAGHSWASGLTPFNDGNNQESSSEAINGYYGMAMLGKQLGDTAMQNQGLLMMAMEIRAANKYWKVYSGNDVYNNPQYDTGGDWITTSKGVGIIWGCKIDDALWFNGGNIGRRMIQMLPITPCSELYIPSAWVTALVGSNEWSTILTEGAEGGSHPGYMCYMQAAKAVNDPIATAWTNVTGLATDQLDPTQGQSMTTLMYWVATRGN